MSETPRAAADRGAAAPRKTPPPLSAVRTKRRLVLWKVLRPVSPPPHAASRTFSTTKENVRSDAHYVGKTGLHLCPARQGGALPHFARPAARCRPNQTRHCRRVVRLGANTLHGASAACPKRRVRRRTGTRPPRARRPRPSAPPGQRDGQLCEKASPGFSPPHAASRTFSTTKENVRSDAHYVGKTGLRLSRAVFPSSPLPRAKKRPRSNPDRGRSACCFFKPRRCTARRCRG